VPVTGTHFRSQPSLAVALIVQSQAAATMLAAMQDGTVRLLATRHMGCSFCANTVRPDTKCRLLTATWSAVFGNSSAGAFPASLSS
jgi:hypothetical protein